MSKRASKRSPFPNDVSYPVVSENDLAAIDALYRHLALKGKKGGFLSHVQTKWHLRQIPLMGQLVGEILSDKLNSHMD